jgi:acyl CoA:acetate/3-ketoacid CoA transferase beta subunit
MPDEGRTTEARLADVVAVACAEAFRGDGEIFGSGMGTMPMLGARLARATFEPDLLVSDGIAFFVDGNLPIGGTDKTIEGWIPFRSVFDTLWGGRRHRRPPHRVSNTERVFTDSVDVVSGIGYDRAAALGDTAAGHRIPRVVTNMAVLDFETPDNTMRLASVHPGISVDDVVAATGFELAVADDVPTSRAATDDELEILELLDPDGLRYREVPDQ